MQREQQRTGRDADRTTRTYQILYFLYQNILYVGKGIDYAYTPIKFCRNKVPAELQRSNATTRQHSSMN